MRGKWGHHPLVYLAYVALLAFFGAFLVYPLLYLIRQALTVGDQFSTLFLQLVWINPISRSHLLNSLLIGLTTVVLSSLVALPLAYLTVRYRFPGRQVLQGLLLASIVLPPFVSVVGIRQLFAQYGAVTLLVNALGLANGPVDWLGQGFWAVVLLETLHLYPILYLNLSAALANIDPAQEEAAASVGLTPWQVLWRVTIPLLAPGYFAGAIIVFIWAFTDLGVPLMFNYDSVLPVRIFNAINDIYANPIGYAMVLWVLGISLLAFFASRWLLGRRQYASVTRGISRLVERQLGRHVYWVYPLLALLVAFSLLPHLGVLLTSLSEHWFMSILPDFSLEYYRTLLSHPLVGRSILNTLVYSFWGMVINLLIGFTAAYFLVRLRLPSGFILDAMVMAPLAIPGIVLAFGLLTGYSDTWLDPRQRPAYLISLAYAVRHFPFIVRTVAAGLQQVPVAMEEAAWSLGVTPLHTLRVITVPLIAANLVAGGILAFVLSVMEVSTGLIMAMEERAYPISKAIWAVGNRIADGEQVAAALGILGMALVVSGLLISSRLLGRRLGELFRAA